MYERRKSYAACCSRVLSDLFSSLLIFNCLPPFPQRPLTGEETKRLRIEFEKVAGDRTYVNTKRVASILSVLPSLAGLTSKEVVAVLEPAGLGRRLSETPGRRIASPSHRGKETTQLMWWEVVALAEELIQRRAEKEAER